MLVQHLLVEHPSAAEFGKACKAWKAIAASISNFKNLGGKLVNEVQRVGAKAAKKQFKELVVFAKGDVNHIRFENVTNNAEECNEIRLCFEDLLKINSGLENKSSAIASQTAAQKMRTGKEQKNLKMLHLEILQLQMMQRNTKGIGRHSFWIEESKGVDLFPDWSKEYEDWERVEALKNVYLEIFPMIIFISWSEYHCNQNLNPNPCCWEKVPKESTVSVCQDPLNKGKSTWWETNKVSPRFSLSVIGNAKIFNFNNDSLSIKQIFNFCPKLWFFAFCPPIYMLNIYSFHKHYYIPQCGNLTSK